MVSWAKWCAALAALGWVAFGAQAREFDGDAIPAAVQIGAESLSADVRLTVAQVIERGDNLARPFAIVDKKGARLFVFGAKGDLVGSTAVLLGLTRGDQPAGDMTGRRPASLMPAERTTPSGRYASEPGHNDKGEDIVWIDYDASLAIHRLRPSPAWERRGERLASTNPEDRRISFGCVVVPVAFYDDVVRPTLGSGRGVVYVLPEGGASDRWPVRPLLTSSR